MLLTAKAQTLFDTDPAASRNAALEANKLLPGFAPAAVAAAKVLFKLNDLRKGAKILEAAWRADAHPDVGALYVHARPGDAVNDRLVRARKLQSMKQNNAESALLVARAALEAGDYKAARDAAESAARMQPREGAFLLLADIEEAETGDQGRVRQYLSKAVRAPRDPAWVADGFVSEQWAPVSPVTGRIDAFEWRAPVERHRPADRPGCGPAEHACGAGADRGERRERRRRGGRHPRRCGSGAGTRARRSRSRGSLTGF